MKKSEADLFWFLAENYVRMRMGILEKDKKAKLDSLDKGSKKGAWASHVENELGIDKEYFKSDELVAVILKHLKKKVA